MKCRVNVATERVQRLSVKLLPHSPSSVTVNTSNGLFTMHGNGTRTGTGKRPGAMGPNILYRNIHTGLRQGKEPESIVSIVLLKFPVPVPVTFPCSVNKPSRMYHFLSSLYMLVLTVSPALSVFPGPGDVVCVRSLGSVHTV